MKLILIPLLATLALTSSVQAQQAPKGDATVEELVDALRPRLRLRGLTVSAVDQQPPSVDLDVAFAYNSADLTEDARQTLSTLAQAMNHVALSSLRFLVAGHTDGIGSAAYNEDLSFARARSVAAYLNNELGIARERLDIEGFGETRLLFPDQPEDGRNRRVEVRTLE